MTKVPFPNHNDMICILVGSTVRHRHFAMAIAELSVDKSAFKWEPVLRPRPSITMNAACPATRNRLRRLGRKLDTPQVARDKCDREGRSVGEAVPQTVHLYRLPARIVDYAPQYRDYEYILVGESAVHSTGVGRAKRICVRHLVYSRFVSTWQRRSMQ